MQQTKEIRLHTINKKTHNGGFKNKSI